VLPVSCPGCALGFSIQFGSNIGLALSEQRTPASCYVRGPPSHSMYISSVDDGFIWT
jgi:hypothetical protein